MALAPLAPRPQLLTYPDSLGGSLQSIDALLRGRFAGMFRGVHILPPFPSSGDRGFAPLTYQRIDRRFGNWSHVRGIARRHDVMLDLMINHISRRSREFQDFERRGRRSPYADLFVTLDKVWPGGDPAPADVEKIFLRKPDAPFSTITVEETGDRERVWTSFGSALWSEQIDLDVTSGVTRDLISGWLRSFARHGVQMVRLDAVGYVIKKPGTSCFMVEPEIYEFLGWITRVAEGLGIVVLPEVHDAYASHERLAARGFWTYDFVLPGLVLDALHTGRGDRLAAHLTRSPSRQFTTLDSHDGIPVRPDLDGILTPTEMERLANRVQAAGGNVNRILSDRHADGGDVHQLNCTYYSAMGCDDELYLTARAIQLFARGIPQIYYVGLLAGSNDERAMAASGDGRAINRHDYTSAEVESEAERPVVRRLFELIRLRNQHPAFDGSLTVEAASPALLQLAWRAGRSRCVLTVDLDRGTATIDAS